MTFKKLQKVAAYSDVLRKLSNASVLGRVGTHLKNQAGKHGVLPTAASVVAGGAMMAGAAKAPSNYKKFKEGFNPANHAREMGL